MLGRFLKRFLRLQWKLTLTYALVTVGVFASYSLVREFSFIFGAGQKIDLVGMPETMVESLGLTAPQLQGYLTADEVDQMVVSQWVEMISSQHEGFTLRFVQNRPEEEPIHFLITAINVAVLNRQGEFVAFRTADGSGGMTFSDDENGVIDSALAGEPLSGHQADGHIIAAVPVWNEGETEVIGAFFATVERPTVSLPSQMLERFLLVVEGGLSDLPIFLLIGILFGYVSTRNMTRRIRRLGETAERWSTGELDIIARDVSEDEIGQLARRLNLMAEQLQNLLQARQQLAVLEERNRLARELHDAVKQQMFAAGMQVGTAQLALKQGKQDVAATHVQEAKELIATMRHELSGLIQELRPAALEDEGLVEALRHYADDWGRHNEIEIGVALQGERPTPLDVEQTLFRVVQEALSNIARHSGAEQVTVHLAWAADDLTLTVSDDGRGFEPAAEHERGVGLRSMQERIEALGGRLTIDSKQGQGTRVQAAVPLAIGTLL